MLTNLRRVGGHRQTQSRRKVMPPVKKSLPDRFGRAMTTPTIPATVPAAPASDGRACEVSRRPDRAETGAWPACALLPGVSRGG